MPTRQVVAGGTVIKARQQVQATEKPFPLGIMPPAKTNGRRQETGKTDAKRTVSSQKKAGRKLKHCFHIVKYFHKATKQKNGAIAPFMKKSAEKNRQKPKTAPSYSSLTRNRGCKVTQSSVFLTSIYSHISLSKWSCLLEPVR